MGNLYYPRCETLNRWCWFDTYFHDGAGSVMLLLLPIKEANISVMTIGNQCPLWLPRMQDLKSFTLRWLSFPGWGRERLSPYFDHKGGRFIQIEHRSTIVNILRLSVRYLNATINRTTWKATLEIGPDWCSQTRQTPPVEGYAAGFGPRRCSGSGSWMVLEPNWTVFLVQTQTTRGLPGPGSNTRQAFARAVRLGPNRVPHTCLQNTAPGGYDNHMCDRHQYAGVAKLWVVNGLVSRPNITTLIIQWMLESYEDHSKWLTANWDMVQTDDASS